MSSPTTTEPRTAQRAGVRVAGRTAPADPQGHRDPQAQPKGKLTLSNGNEAITILLVDDDPDCRLLIRDAVAGCDVGNRVYEVCNGADALDFLHRRGPFQDAPRPGLIYLDIEMPGMDGQETLRRIRQNPEFKDVPVVMMTGVSEEAQMELAAANGANSYTIKPANAEQFLRTVLASTNYWLAIHQTPQHHLRAGECRR